VTPPPPAAAESIPDTNVPPEPPVPTVPVPESEHISPAAEPAQPFGAWRQDFGYYWYHPAAVVPGAHAGWHPRYPYYSYRRPWYPAGPASANVTIIW
jgi:hypothetical protein